MSDNGGIVLIVDDDKQMAELFERCLNNHGIKTLVAHNAIEALALLSPFVVLVITDFDMPCLNGMDLRQMIRHKNPSLPVIGITGVRDIDRDLFFHSFDDALFKPFRMAHLLASVKNVLKRLSVLL